MANLHTFFALHDKLQISLKSTTEFQKYHCGTPEIRGPYSINDSIVLNYIDLIVAYIYTYTHTHAHIIYLYLFLYLSLHLHFSLSIATYVLKLWIERNAYTLFKIINIVFCQWPQNKTFTVIIEREFISLNLQILRLC